MFQLFLNCGKVNIDKCALTRIRANPILDITVSKVCQCRILENFENKQKSLK